MNCDQKKNVIILTGGLAGSSVLTALLASDGYWTGDTTFKKSDYDTHENLELVALNKNILAEVGFDEPWTMRFEPWYTRKIESGLSAIDRDAAEQFWAKCNSNPPWVWKDPRLWLTIRFWEPYIDFSNTAFLVIHREPLQAWISTTKRRQIQTFAYLKNYEDCIHKVISDFLKEQNATYLDVLYEDLIVSPESTIERINGTLNTKMTTMALGDVFRGKLYQKQHGLGSFLYAMAVYAKNFRSRYRL